MRKFKANEVFPANRLYIPALESADRNIEIVDLHPQKFVLKTTINPEFASLKVNLMVFVRCLRLSNDEMNITQPSGTDFTVTASRSFMEDEPPI